MTRNAPPTNKGEMLLFLLAFVIMGAALGFLTGTDPQQRLVGLGVGCLLGIIVGVPASFLLNKWRATADATIDEKKANSMSINPSPGTRMYPSNLKLTITDVYTSETIPVQITLLVSYQDPIAVAHDSQVDRTSPANSNTASNGATLTTGNAEVVRSLVTSEVRRYILSRAIDELETPETLDAISQRIVDEVNPSLAYWQLKVDAINVDGIKLPDDVIAGKVTLFLREGQAETDRRIAAARLEAQHKELQVLQHVAEASCTRARNAGVSNARQPSFVLRDLLTEMKNQTIAADTWPTSLETLLASLDDNSPAMGVFQHARA